ncbi:MAG: glycosyltransferase [Fimbriimonadaceae bacterium]
MASLIVIAPVKGPEERVRIKKLIDVLRSADHEIEFWGWERGIEKTPPDPDLSIRTLHRGGGYGGKKMLLHYPIWMLKVWWAVLTRSKGKPLYCLSFDTAFPAAMAGAKRFLFDDADNFSKISNWPGLLRRLIERGERFAARRAKVHLLPSKARTVSIQPNDRFLPNMPTRDAVDKARQIATERRYEPGDGLTVLVTGRMVGDRGVGQILGALRLVSPGGPSGIRLLVAGRTFSPEAEELIKEPGVEYVGTVPNEEALALNYRASVVLTYYNPDIEINRVAEPNKWGDCIVTNTPFIVNSEVTTAKEFVDAGACFSVPYQDVQGLANLLLNLAENPGELNEVKSRLATFAAPAWDDGMNKIVEEWLA